MNNEKKRITSSSPAPLYANHIFVTGAPGVGKTTLACAALRDIVACGFYTDERRSSTGERLGFDVTDICSGQTGTLASLGRGKTMVGKYCVDVPSFERIALPSLDASMSSPITLIDEVGKMEMFSLLFLPRVAAILSGKSTVLGTLPMARNGHTIAEVEAIRADPTVAVVKLSKANRDEAALAVQVVLEAVARQRPGEPLDVSPLERFLQEGQSEKLRGIDPPQRNGIVAGTVQPSTLASETAAAPASPLLGERPRVLLLGETASATSLSGELPYADRSMWAILRAALELPNNTPLAKTQAACLAAGVAVWDTLANVHQRSGRRRGAAEAERHNDVPALLAAYPSIICIGFIGTRSRAAFDRRPANFALVSSAVQLKVLPSSSRANTQPLATKAADWRRVIMLGQ